MYNNKKILAIIPARGGSKGVKRKNIRELNGKPLIAWTIVAAQKSNYIDRTVVVTEDLEIEHVSKNFNIEVMNRPENLAQDDSPTIDTIIYALEELEKEQYIPDYVMLIQCTSPLRTEKHIDEAILKILEAKETADALVSITKEEHPPYWLKSIDEKGYLKDFIEYDKKKYTRRQDFPNLYRLNGAIYIVKTEVLRDKRTFQPERTMAYIMDATASVDIDTEEDFRYIENILISLQIISKYSIKI